MIKESGQWWHYENRQPRENEVVWIAVFGEVFPAQYDPSANRWICFHGNYPTKSDILWMPIDPPKFGVPENFGNYDLPENKNINTHGYPPFNELVEVKYNGGWIMACTAVNVQGEPVWLNMDKKILHGVTEYRDLPPNVDDTPSGETLGRELFEVFKARSRDLSPVQLAYGVNWLRCEASNHFKAYAENLKGPTEPLMEEITKKNPAS